MMRYCLLCVGLQTALSQVLKHIDRQTVSSKPGNIILYVVGIGYSLCSSDKPTYEHISILWATTVIIAHFIAVSIKRKNPWSLISVLISH